MSSGILPDRKAFLLFKGFMYVSGPGADGLPATFQTCVRTPPLRSNPDRLKSLVKRMQAIGACPLGRVLFILHPPGADQLVSEVHDLIVLFEAQKPHDHRVGKIKVHRPVPVPKLIPDSGPVVGAHEQMPVSLLDRADERGLQPSVKGQKLSQIIHDSLQRGRGHIQRTPSPHRAR